MAVFSPESWSTYGLHWLLIKKRISAGLSSLIYFFFHLQKFKRLHWAITSDLHPLEIIPQPLQLCLILGWRFRLVFMVRISKEELNLCQLRALINCPDFFVHWTAGTKTSIRIFVYQLCPLVERALGKERGTLSSQSVGLRPPSECHRAPTLAVGRWWTEFSFWHWSSFLTITLSLSNSLIINFSIS